MAKDKERKVEEEEAKRESKPAEVTLSLEAYIEDSPATKQKDSNAGPAFSAWFLRIKKRSAHERLTMLQWEDLLKKFLTEEVR